MGNGVFGGLVLRLGRWMVSGELGVEWSFMMEMIPF